MNNYSPNNQQGYSTNPQYQQPYPLRSQQGVTGNAAKQAGVFISKKVLIIIGAVASGMIAVGVFIAVLVLVIGGSRGNTIVGAWKNPNTNQVQFEFFEDGTCSGIGASYYEASENGILTTFDSYHYPDDKLYYEVDGNKLYIANSMEELKQLKDQKQGFIRDKK